ncbi:MAG TPA: SDR family NAD(P)-dependent oxidoreductase, partial [Phycisphaerae bacterium]|nr:SDR family NAD(P)-dependent oxidoreductase [Phycisphaerae bacterium]
MKKRRKLRNMKDNWPKFDDNATLVDKLVGISRYYGADPQFVLAGGGNTSAKTDKVLYVKASGRALATIDAGGFVAMDRQKLTDLLNEDLGEEPIERERRFKEGVIAARMEPAGDLRPSVECLLHNLVPQRFVVHTHSALANAVACCAGGEEIARKLFGDSIIWIPATEPGHTLVRPIAEALRRHKARTGAPGPDAIIMQNHGLLICGDEPDEIRDRTDAIIGKCRKCVKAAGDRPAFGRVSRIEGETAGKLINVIAPALRGLLAKGDSLKIVTFDDSELSVSLACGAEGRRATELGPIMPDQIIYCGSFPMWYAPPASADEKRIVEGLRKGVAAHKAHWKDAPMVVLVPGVGMFTAGDDFAWADNARTVYLNAIEVMAGASRLGGILPLTPEHRRFIETWEAEAYRKRIAKAAALNGRAANKVAVVTGAAQGFGLEIAQDLARQGAYVALTDINEKGAREAAETICG